MTLLFSRLRAAQRSIPLAGEQKEKREALATQLQTTLAQTAVANNQPRPVSEEDAKRLEALGYVQ